MFPTSGMLTIYCSFAYAFRKWLLNFSFMSAALLVARNRRRHWPTQAKTLLPSRSSHASKTPYLNYSVFHCSPSLLPALQNTTSSCWKHPLSFSKHTFFFCQIHPFPYQSGDVWRSLNTPTSFLGFWTIFNYQEGHRIFYFLGWKKMVLLLRITNMPCCPGYKLQTLNPYCPSKGIYAIMLLIWCPVCAEILIKSVTQLDLANMCMSKTLIWVILIGKEWVEF